MTDDQKKNSPDDSEILMDETSEVQVTRDELQATNEELLVTSDEVQATDDEVQVTRDELQATNEELLVTSDEVQATDDEVQVTRDELQATNEELLVTSEETELITSETVVDPETVVAFDSLTEPELEYASLQHTDVHLDGELSRLDIFERLKLAVEEPQKYTRNEVDTLKHTYYKIRRSETETLKNGFLEGGGAEQDFIIPEDDIELQFKALISEYKQKQASLQADEERQKEQNLIIKQHLIDRLKILTESQDDFNKRYNEFRDIQRQWKDIKLIPQENSKELWRNYQLYNERFYDLVKINNQFRDYDYKKNLEIKTVLCETVERLTAEEDVISAFHQLQKIRQQWREIGRVSKEHRDTIWERFKVASSTITKRHHAYYDDIKGQEERNLEIKTEICEEMESIDFDALKTLRDWEKKTEKVMALQTKWRTIGYATKKQHVKIFERYRAASDQYFNKKAGFYKSIKKEIDKNVELKKALVEKAESMKNNVDWKETTKRFIELQNEWKTIGPISRKYSDSLWKQFIAACDHFFDRKNKEATSQKSEEYDNLDAKKALIEKINSIDVNLPEEEALTLFRGYLSEWNSIGYVPFKEKDKLRKAFRTAVDKQFDLLKVNERDRRIQQYRSNLTEISGSGKNLYDERDKLMRTYDRMKIDLQTYENNVGFISSKGGGGLLKEMDRKISRLRDEMEVVVKKIEAIDENFEY